LSLARCSQRCTDNDEKLTLQPLKASCISRVRSD